MRRRVARVDTNSESDSHTQELGDNFRREVECAADALSMKKTAAISGNNRCQKNEGVAIMVLLQDEKVERKRAVATNNETDFETKLLTADTSAASLDFVADRSLEWVTSTEPTIRFRNNERCDPSDTASRHRLSIYPEAHWIR